MDMGASYLIDMFVCFDKVHRQLAQWRRGRVPKSEWDPSLQDSQVRHDLCESRKIEEEEN